MMIIFLAFLFCAPILTAQEETGGQSTPTHSWSMLSVHRVWTEKYNGMPNGGIGITSLFSLDQNRQWWLGFSIVGTGLDKRDALAIDMVGGTWIVGDSRLGAFMFAGTGLGMSSGSGLTGFDFFTDQTLVYGLASQAGVGGVYELFTNIKLHLNAFGMWFTTDGGPLPIGLQAGLTFGGK